MQFKHVFLCVFAIIAAGNCENETDSNPNVLLQNKDHKSDSIKDDISSARGLNFGDFLPCVVQLDLGCVFDRTEVVLQDTTKTLMSELKLFS